MKSFLSKSSKLWMVPAAAIGLAAIAAPQPAHAGAQAFATVFFDDALFVDSATGIPLFLNPQVGPPPAHPVAGGMNVSVPDGPFIESQTNTASRTAGPVTAPNPDIKIASDTTISNGVSVNPLKACVGPGCDGAQDVFTKHAFNTIEQVEADSFVVGTGFFGSPSDTRMKAEAGTQQGSTDSATSNTSTTAQFTIIPNAAISITFTATVSQELFVALHDNAVGSASAQLSFNITVRPVGGGAPLVLVPDPNALLDNQLNVTQAAFTPGGSSDSFVLAPVLIGISTPVLVAGQAYTFQVNWNATADVDVVKVPEPAPLALLGLGLLGMVAARRRKALPPG